MGNSIIESSYSLAFRNEEVKQLEEFLSMHYSVELIGMKRVGINNFLRFFLSHKTVGEDSVQLFILVDLNALIERELFAFWRLTFKRIADNVRDSSLSKEVKEKIANIYDTSIQSGDLFLTYDGVHESLGIIVGQGVSPVIIFTRFDRLQEVITHEFFDNLQGLKDAASHKLSFVFTGYRPLETMAPDVFKTKSVSMFSHIQYIKPAISADMDIILSSFEQRYQLTIPEEIHGEMLRLCGGHVQYLQLLLIIYYEITKKRKISVEKFIETIHVDERIALQSEELWESLTVVEHDVLKKILTDSTSTEQEKEKGHYLWDTGFVIENSYEKVFSPLFTHYVTQKLTSAEDNSLIEFTKKELALFNLLKSYPDQISEREKIIEIVWPEYKDYGVSDWSLDKLVARVRSKLKKQKSLYEIVTVKTRGYKLIQNNT